MNESVWSNSGTILTGKFELLGEETYSIATLSANLTWQKTELWQVLSPIMSILHLNLFTLYINTVRTAQKTFIQLQNHSPV